jgi:hypothetical protein
MASEMALASESSIWSGLPGPDPRPDPDWSTVRKVSASGRFIDRSPTRRAVT